MNDFTFLNAETTAMLDTNPKLASLLSKVYRAGVHFDIAHFWPDGACEASFFQHVADNLIDNEIGLRVDDAQVKAADLGRVILEAVEAIVGFEAAEVFDADRFDVPDMDDER